MKYFADIADIPHNKRLLIYGAGGRGRTLLTKLREERSDLELLGFVDTYRSGWIHGLEVLKFEDFLKAGLEYDLIIIASVHWNVIETTLQNAGAEAYLIYTEGKLSGAAHIAPDIAEEYASQFSRARALLATEEDRALYDLILKLRQLNPDGSDYETEVRDALSPIFRISNHYLDFINRKAIKTVIEGGVEFGVNTKAFLECFAPECVVYGFEPNYDPQRQDELTELARQEPERVRLIPLGLWDSKGRVSFSVSGSSSHIVSDFDDIRPETPSIETTSVDLFVKEQQIEKLDFIKLDVEGAEMKVLEGARRTFSEHRPQAAISIYHSIEDLFEIPLLMSDLSEDYLFHLGHYADSFNETILYAIPRELESSA